MYISHVITHKGSFMPIVPKMKIVELANGVDPDKVAHAMRRLIISLHCLPSSF